MPGSDGRTPVRDAEAWLRFAFTPKLGPATQRKLLKAFGGPQEALDAPAAEVARTAGEPAAQALRTGADAAPARRTHWPANHGSSDPGSVG